MATKGASRVQFFTVQNAKSKLTFLRSLAERHFRTKEPLAILLPGEAAKTFLDQYLWEQPREGFLPHSGPCSPIHLYAEGVPDDVDVLLNLRPQAVNLAAHSCAKLYELFDRSHPEKERAALIRVESYRRHGIEPSLDAS